MCFVDKAYDLNTKLPNRLVFHIFKLFPLVRTCTTNSQIFLIAFNFYWKILTMSIAVLRRRSSNAVVVEPQTVAESPAPAGEVYGNAATPSVDGASCRYALRRRRSLQQKDEEGCCASSLAATADDVRSYLRRYYFLLELCKRAIQFA